MKKRKKCYFNSVLGIIFILVLLISASCQNKKAEISEDVFPFKKEINGKVLVKSEMLEDPWDLCVKDSFILIGNLKGDPQLEIFNVNGEFLMETLPKGQGPSEALAIGLIQSNSNDGLFYIYDLLGRKILEFDIDSLLIYEKYSPSIYFNFLNNNRLKSDINKALIANNYFICDNRTHEGRILLMSKDGNLIKYCLDFPRVNPQISDVDNATLFGSVLTLSPKKDRFAIATSMASMIDIFKLNSESIDSVWAYHENLPNDIYISQGDGFTQAFFTDKSKIGYLDITSSKKYIYALYSGLSSEDEHYGYANKVRIVSWNGEKRFEVKTNSWLSRIDVDANDEFLYGVSLNEETGPEILVFELK